ncbi:MAG: hypothetical protein WD407_00300 [Rhodospirillales bacterium]
MRSCLALFKAADDATAPATDAEAVRIPGFPYLRANRFLASFAEQNLDRPAFDAWVRRLRDLDRRARLTESANLPASNGTTTPTPDALERCAARLIEHDFAVQEYRDLLRESARVPDSYNRWAQALGLYPLSAIPVRFGIMSLHGAQRADFASPGADTPTRIYAPAVMPYKPAAVRRILRAMPRDSLGVPRPDRRSREHLLDAFAPVFEVETETRDDRLGAPAYDTAGRVTVDTTAPTVYRRLAFTRFHGEIVIQLVYTAWFPARTPSGFWDPFAGKLDGILWRVSLGPDGRPILYDSIHACGCYHLFFPVEPWRIAEAEQHGFYAEPPLAPVPGPAPGPGQRIRLTVKSGTHYLSGVAAGAERPEDRAPGPGAHRLAYRLAYRLADEDRLRALAHPRGRKSLYGPDGLIAASERPERFFLWPMGVPSAGAMRQWGHHATAFFGTRHFDDADLLERVLAR